MNLILTPTQSDIFKVLGDFLTQILPSSVTILQAQENRIPEPSTPDFVLMNSTFRSRLSTNVDEYLDCLFTGSIAGTTLTVTAVAFGNIIKGAPIFGAGIAANTSVVNFISGTGGAGTYQITPTQTVASETMAAGVANLKQPTEVVIQLDVHGPNGGDNMQIISTAFRDGYAVDFFTAANPAISPLYADDGKQIPFINAEQQFENRWILEAYIQADQAITNIPQQFAGTLKVGIINVEATYPS